MKQQEINFKCLHCGKEVQEADVECGSCKHGLAWGRIQKTYEDKYLVIYDVLV